MYPIKRRSLEYGILGRQLRHGLMYGTSLRSSVDGGVTLGDETRVTSSGSFIVPVRSL